MFAPAELDAQEAMDRERGMRQLERLTPAYAMALPHLFKAEREVQRVAKASELWSILGNWALLQM
ncbi:MAG: hypothetical protein GY820_05455 [Gammaproteobacteria bacterium]|nr:hypothetical protein [Gammaproteobacteria bacterium]